MKAADGASTWSLKETEKYTGLALEQVPESVSLSKLVQLLRGTDILSLERTSPSSALVTLFSYFDMFRMKEKMGEELRAERQTLRVRVRPCRSSLSDTERERLYLAHGAGGTRNVMVGNLEDFMDESFIREEAEKYGKIDSFKYFRDRKVSYIEFFSFVSAIKFVSAIHEDSLFQHVRIGFGKDKCNGEDSECGGAINNRTVYFGNIPLDASMGDILGAVQGGAVFSVKQIKEKKCAFITFIDHLSAAALIEYGNAFSVFIKGIPIKVGSGKLMPLPQIVPILIYNQVSRVIALQLNGSISSVKLEMELSRYGEIESVEKKDSCLVVSYANLQDAYTAYTDLTKNNPAIGMLLSGYREDPCARTTARDLIMQVQQKELG